MNSPVVKGAARQAAGLFRFGIGAVVSFGTTLGVTALLHEALALPEELAFAGGIVAAFVVNFFVLRYFVFAGTQRGGGEQFLMFLAASIGFRAGEYVGFLLLHTLLGVQYLLASAAVLAASFLCKFMFYDRVVFKRRA